MGETILKGPNSNFVNSMLKKGGDVKVGGLRKVELESVNHEDGDGTGEGKKKLPDTNPGADRQNHEVHGEEPHEKGRLSGIHQPKIGGSEESIASVEKLNRPPRSFTFNREGHSVNNDK